MTSKEKWKKARRKPEFVKFREPLPIHTWSRCAKKGEWTLGEGHGDFAIPSIHVIVFGRSIPFAMEKKRFFQEFEEVIQRGKTQ